MGLASLVQPWYEVVCDCTTQGVLFCYPWWAAGGFKLTVTIYGYSPLCL
jgi:hypothetical protein